VEGGGKMAIREIKIPATWVQKRTNDILTHGKPPVVYGTAIFGLGVGPCGKTVIELDYSIDTAGVTVYQVCSDTERKTFFYPMHTLTGRVEVTEE
jgi:hypothetical protein